MIQLRADDIQGPRTGGLFARRPRLRARRPVAVDAARVAVERLPLATYPMAKPVAKPIAADAATNAMLYTAME
ncbi:MAG TPA: hypothetical protein VGQ83_35125 [Polyangia bacterium]|jgi:hypothetical protein